MVLTIFWHSNGNFPESQVHSLLYLSENGSIDFTEFEEYVLMNGLSRPTGEEFGQEMRDAFEMFDQNQNGFLEVEELRNLMITFGGHLTVWKIAIWMSKLLKTCLFFPEKTCQNLYFFPKYRNWQFWHIFGKNGRY